MLAGSPFPISRTPASAITVAYLQMVVSIPRLVSVLTDTNLNEGTRGKVHTASAAFYTPAAGIRNRVPSGATSQNTTPAGALNKGLGTPA